MKFSKTLLLVLSLSTLSFGAAHVTSRTVKYVATASPVRYVKDGAKGTYFVSKETYKVARFPFRHPVKTAHGAYKGVSKTATFVF